MSPTDQADQSAHLNWSITSRLTYGSSVEQSWFASCLVHSSKQLNQAGTPTQPSLTRLSHPLSPAWPGWYTGSCFCLVLISGWPLTFRLCLLKWNCSECLQCSCYLHLHLNSKCITGWICLEGPKVCMNYEVATGTFLQIIYSHTVSVICVWLSEMTKTVLW